MPETLTAALAICAGTLVAIGVGVACGIHRAKMAVSLPGLVPEGLARWTSLGEWQQALELALERAGWPLDLRRALALGGAVALIPAALGLLAGPAVGSLGLVGGIGACGLSLNSAISRRRRRMQGELVPLLELFSLELGAGGSALSALGSVAVQVQGPLAADLRRMLIAGHLAGSAALDERLTAYAARFRIPPLASLATILSASREYGTGTIQGVRALALDLRRAQRRELIERSRQALNLVLVPAAFGVLLPFLGILLFPAVSALQRNL